jgi:hypothetical protein
MKNSTFRTFEIEQFLTNVGHIKILKLWETEFSKSETITYSELTNWFNKQYKRKSRQWFRQMETQCIQTIEDLRIL